MMDDNTLTENRVGSGAALFKRSCGLHRINILVGALSVPFFIILWELIARSGVVNIVLFPPPSVVAVAVLEWMRSGQFFWDLLAASPG